MPAAGPVMDRNANSNRSVATGMVDCYVSCCKQLCAISFQRSRLCKFRANYKHRLFRALRGAPRRIWLGSGKSEERNAFDLVDDESQIRR